MPLPVWIVLVALTAASPSFAKEAAPKGAVHSWSQEAERAAEPAVVPAGEPDLVPRSALSSDFPMIDTSAPYVAPVAADPAPVASKPSSDDAEPAPAAAAPNADVLAAVAAPPVALESPAVAATPGPYGTPAAPIAPAAILDQPETEPGQPAAVVDQPAAVVEEPAAVVEEPAAELASPPPAPKRERLPVVMKPRIPSGAAEKAAARAYLAAMQARPDPFQIESTRRPASDDSAHSPEHSHSAVLPPKIIDVATPNPYGAPINRTADREQLMREFPDELVEKMWMQDWTDLERAYQFGQLVDVPSDPDGRGIVLRLEGGSRIGELVDDAYRQTLLCRLTKPALGLLYRIAARMRQIEGPDFVPLEITSLVRTWDYQLRLSDVNPNADRTRDGVPPTHVLGMAFDIARTQMSYERQLRIEALFAEMSQAGEMAYYKEGSANGLMHYHVMALPSAETQLARYYERDSRFREQASSDTGERARLPEAPCVTFGSSLEPFSAICSCELPLEVSASTPGAATAPISR